MKIHKKNIIVLTLALTLLLLAGILTSRANHMQFFENNASRSLPDIVEAGTKAMRRNRPDSALAFYAVAMSSVTPKMSLSDKTALARANNNAGYIYFFEYSDYSKAYSCFLNAKEIADELDLTSIRCRSLLNIGNIYGVYGIEEEAIDMYRSAFYLALEHHDWDIVLTSFINLAGGFTGKLDVSPIADVMDAFSKADIPDSIPNLRYSRHKYNALVCIADSDYSGAAAQLQAAVASLPDGLGSRRMVSGENFIQAILLQKCGRDREAAARLRSMVDSAGGDADIERECWQALAEHYSRSGRNDSAQLCRLRQYAIQDSLFNLRKFGTIKDLESSFEHRKMENDFRALAEKKRTRELALAITSVAAALILLLLMWVWYKKRQLHASNIELYKRYRELTDMHDNLVRSNSTAEAAIVAKENSAADKDNNASELYARIIAVMNTDAIFDRNFSADTLAGLTDSKSRYISHALASCGDKNFATLLAEYRIREAGRRISDTEAFGHLTLEAIAESVGFKSRTTFSTTFKKITGLTPREYQKIASDKVNSL